MIVTVATMDVMEVTVDQEIEVVVVAHTWMAAGRAVLVIAGVRLAAVGSTEFGSIVARHHAGFLCPAVPANRTKTSVPHNARAPMSVKACV